jgi:hypothetical protein
MVKKLIADRGVQASATAAPVLAIATWLSGDLVWIVGILWGVWAIAATVAVIHAVRRSAAAL